MTLEQVVVFLKQEGWVKFKLCQSLRTSVCHACEHKTEKTECELTINAVLPRDKYSWREDAEFGGESWDDICIQYRQWRQTVTLSYLDLSHPADNPYVIETLSQPAPEEVPAERFDSNV